MVLSDREIQAALENGHIVINPPPNAEAFSSTSVDLTLGSTVRVWSPTNTPGVEAEVFTPGVRGYESDRIIQEHTERSVIPADGLIVEPSDFVLAWTRERIELPSEHRIAARVEGKSSLARLGIGVHVTAPTIHAGYRGVIQLEVCNHGPVRVKLHAGMSICQLIFEETHGTPEKAYTGQFLDQQPS